MVNNERCEDTVEITPPVEWVNGDINAELLLTLHRADENGECACGYELTCDGEDQRRTLAPIYLLAQPSEAGNSPKCSGDGTKETYSCSCGDEIYTPDWEVRDFTVYKADTIEKLDYIDNIDRKKY